MRTYSSGLALLTNFPLGCGILSCFTWKRILLTFIRAIVSTRTIDTTSLISVILVSTFFILVSTFYTNSSNTFMTRISSFAYFTGCSISFTICARLTSEYFFCSRAVKASFTCYTFVIANLAILSGFTRYWLN